MTIAEPDDVAADADARRGVRVARPEEECGVDDELYGAWKALLPRARCFLLALVCLFGAVCVFGTAAIFKATAPACAACPALVACPAREPVGNPFRDIFTIAAAMLRGFLYDLSDVAPTIVSVEQCIVGMFLLAIAGLTAISSSELLWRKLLERMEKKMRTMAVDAMTAAAAEAAAAAAADASSAKVSARPGVSSSSSSSTSAVDGFPLGAWNATVYRAVMHNFKMEGIPERYWSYFTDWLAAAKGGVFKPAVYLRAGSHQSRRYLAPALAMQMLLASEPGDTECQRIVILTPPGKAETRLRIALANLSFDSSRVHVVSDVQFDLLYHAGTRVIVVDLYHIVNYTYINSRLSWSKLTLLGSCECGESSEQQPTTTTPTTSTTPPL